MTADLKPYPTYKPSGVEWLGDVPAHWEVRRLKNICRLAYGDSLSSENRADGTVPVYGSNGQVGMHSNPNTGGQCLIIGRKGSFGKVHYSAEPVFAIDTTFFVDSRYTAANIRWLYYLLGWLQLDAVSKDSAVPGLNREDAYQHIGFYPPLAEQVAIVRYLDHTDGRIRRYLRSRERLIELLKEYRQAVIYESVTRGLDPDVPLKPSGVEWLGDVPAHWEVRRLKHWIKINEAVLPETTDPNFDFRYLEIGAVGTGVLVEEPSTIRFAHAPSRARRIVKSGDTIISTVRTYLKAVWFAEEVNDALICSTGFAVLTPRRATAPKFVSYVVQNNAFTDRVTAESVGIAYPAIAESRFRSFYVCVPPLAEQAAIAAYLDKQTAAIDAAMARAQREIDLLSEYRTRLIADVVTGQVDVREVAGLPDDTKEPGFDKSERV